MIDDAYSWWRSALRGESPAIHVSEPHAGLFKTRLVRGGPFVSARIWVSGERDDLGRLIEDEVFHCEINGQDRDALECWPWLAGRPIDETEFRLLSRLGPWARQHAPRDPNADPTKAIDFMTAPIPAFKQRRKRA